MRWPSQRIAGSCDVIYGLHERTLRSSGIVGIWVAGEVIGGAEAI